MTPGCLIELNTTDYTLPQKLQSNFLHAPRSGPSSTKLEVLKNQASARYHLRLVTSFFRLQVRRITHGTQTKQLETAAGLDDTIYF